MRNSVACLEKGGGIREPIVCSCNRFEYLPLLSVVFFMGTRLVQVYLHVDVTCRPAVDLYESMGYELVSMLEVSFQVWAAYIQVLFSQYFLCFTTVSCEKMYSRAVSRYP